MTGRTTIRRMLVILAVSTVCAASAALAGGGFIEVVAGQYQAGDDFVDDSTFLGLRGGTSLSERFDLEGSLSLVQSSESVGEIGEIDFDLVLTDLSVKWHPLGGRGMDPFLYGGPGWAFVQVDGLVAAIGDTATAHAGAGVNLRVGRFLVRPDVKARWYEQSGEIDTEATLSLGYAFGWPAGFPAR